MSAECPTSTGGDTPIRDSLRVSIRSVLRRSSTNRWLLQDEDECVCHNQLASEEAAAKARSTEATMSAEALQCLYYALLRDIDTWEAADTKRIEQLRQETEDARRYTDVWPLREVLPGAPRNNVYPRRPLCDELAAVIYQWLFTNKGRWPLDLFKMPVLVETRRAEAQFDESGARLYSTHIGGTPSLADASTSPEQWLSFAQIVLDELGDEGVHAALRVRRTEGSMRPAVLPAVSSLWRAFNERHSLRPGNTLTVGARALLKHGHRGQERFWWAGRRQAPSRVAEQNEMAARALHAILEQCAWINVHMLPHSLPTIELRNERGYGVRWTLEPIGGDSGQRRFLLEFRGFLEPPSEDGHAVGWQH